MVVAPILNPDTPYLEKIPHGMFPGRMVRFCGLVPSDPKRFSLNFQCGPNTDVCMPFEQVAFHLDFRFDYGHEVVRNAFGSRGWGREERGRQPLRREDSFEVLVLCTSSSFKVTINGVPYCKFRHRLDLKDITHLYVWGDVTIDLITYEVQPRGLSSMAIEEQSMD